MALKFFLFALALAISHSAIGQTNPLYLGTWKLNLAKSKFDAGPLPWKDITLKVEAAGDAERRTIETVRADGTHDTQAITLKYDGQDYPRTGSPIIDTMSFRRIDAYSWELTSKKAGKANGKAIEVLSKDGKLWTSKISITRASDGQVLHILQVFDKQ